MVQRDQNRVVLGAVAAAGFMFVLYIIGKKLTRRKEGEGDSSQQQPQGSVELDKSSKTPLEAEPLAQDSQTMSAPATASAAQPTAVESESTSSSSSQAPRTREGSMYYDSYGGYQRTHTADTMSFSKHGDRKSVMAETMSDFKSPRVSWYSGNMPPQSTAINATSQAETSVSVADSQPRVSSNIQGAAFGDEPPLKMKPPMYYDHYGGNFMTHTSHTLSFSYQKDKKFVVSESQSELKGPRVAWHTEDNQPIIVPVSKETESLEKVVASHEEVLKAEESAEYKEVVYSMAKGTADDVSASTLTQPPELEKGDARKGEADGTDGGGMGAGGTGEAPMVAEKAQKQEANATPGKAGREFGVGGGREAGGTPEPAKEAFEEEEAGDGPVFKPAWMKKSSQTAGSASAAPSWAGANGQRRQEAQLGRVSSEQAAPAAPSAAAAAPPAAALDMQAVTAAIMKSQSRPNEVTEKDVTMLLSCLQQPNPSLLLTALGCMSRCANFTQNQRLLREAGCVEQLQALLEKHRSDARAGETTDEPILSAALMVITNMATDLDNQARLEVCLQPLMELVLSGQLKQETSLSALRVLTNLSVTSAFHGHYTHGVQQLYSLLQSSAPPLQLQLLRILVNLSCNPDMAPHLLAAKAPENLVSLLEKDEASGLPLRVVTFLANVEGVVQKQRLTPSALPTLDKAASPETLFSIMHGQLSRGNLRSKVFRLTNSADEDVAHHARRLYSSLGAT